jgi:uncharacterized protein YcfJ
MADNKLTIIIVAAVALLAMIFTGGCESDAQTGTAVGALGGAAVGQAVGHDTKSTAIGAGAGALGGYILGKQSDNRKEKKAEEAAAAAQKAQDEANIIPVKITNSNGSVYTVKLKKQGNVYVGPRGEEYAQMPTEDQLKQVYGW